MVDKIFPKLKEFPLFCSVQDFKLKSVFIGLD
jgi:hypothetical protein